MHISGGAPQVRTMDMARTLAFYTDVLGFALEFNYQNFYAGLRAGGLLVHLKLVDCPDPSIPYVDEGGHLHLYLQTDDVVACAERLRSLGVRLVRDVHETAWQTKELVCHDDQGHTIYIGEAMA